MLEVVDVVLGMGVVVIEGRTNVVAVVALAARVDVDAGVGSITVEGVGTSNEPETVSRGG